MGDTDAPGERWETCHILEQTIKYTAFRGNDYRFYAEAIGPNGRYIAAASDPYHAKQSAHVATKKTPLAYISPTYRNALDQLIERLTKDGWDYVGQGERWYQRTFRRRVR